MTLVQQNYTYSFMVRWLVCRISPQTPVTLFLSITAIICFSFYYKVPHCPQCQLRLKEKRPLKRALSYNAQWAIYSLLFLGMNIQQIGCRGKKADKYGCDGVSEYLLRKMPFQHTATNGLKSGSKLFSWKQQRNDWD